ncbi:hypothetical protein CONLIGDRAFT_577736 [Coniochaeta ligniaria NRRL 30616]|uniref:Distal membrane-arm assembly complex protein 1-like domain-containing protein n=1 Tax=Coniochaeta ligniaria NRRL 30616 TaxID=1408157 RepID=A0A1J7JI21_9PEZI|nr:hypothetical protein CONLIGDRAFT_577736 [Coniochaeta ligniaria NRRL 30616]
MAGDKTPSIYALDKPEKLDDLLKQDRGEDCLPCKIVGGGAFLGLAAYSYLSGTSQLEKNKAQIIAKRSMFGMRSRKLGITGISLSLAYLGIWRLVK